VGEAPRVRRPEFTPTSLGVPSRLIEKYGAPDAPGVEVQSSSRNSVFLFLIRQGVWIDRRL